MFGFLWIKILMVGCVLQNRSTYLIPSAQVCVPEFYNKMDAYLFGPCNSTTECSAILKQCMHAEGRETYCYTRDAHFCAFQSSGNYSDYYIVECG